MSDRQENVVVIEFTIDQEFYDTSSNLTANESLMDVKNLERCFNEGIDREMGKIVDTVEDGIQKANLTAIDSIITAKIKLAVMLMNASSGRDATSVLVNSEPWERIGVTVPFENVSERNITLHVLNTNVETRNNIPEEVSK